MPNSILGNILKRDRMYILGGMALLLIPSWWYTIDMAQAMSHWTCPMMVQNSQSWTPAYFFMMFMMWVVMMVAMMLPSVAPMILVFASIHRQRREQHRPFVPTAFFLAGYVLAWTGFSAVATVLQWQLHRVALMSPMMTSTNALFTGFVLFSAGLFQFTPFKKTCLLHCRNPIDFIMAKWQEGKMGALRMGLQHGSFCMGCCWLLMGLLFVVGVMNLLWVALLTGFVLLEKLIQKSEWVRYLAGGALILWSIYVMGFGV